MLEVPKPSSLSAAATAVQTTVAPLGSPLASPSAPELPDVSKPEPSLNWGPLLPWVGMREIELPLRLQLQEGSTMISARLDIGVSLDRQDARGIHMSRLYKLATESLPPQNLTLKVLEDLSLAALETHQGLSHELKMALKFSLPLKRQALKSDGAGWRLYPVVLRFDRKVFQSLDVSQTAKPYVEPRIDQTRAEIEVEVLYSSTCPASAALSRQLNQQRSLQFFDQQSLGAGSDSRGEWQQWLASPASLAATPHAQRSRAVVKVVVEAPLLERPISEVVTALVDQIEAALGTPVQSLVKREDEQEFARRNADNLMFCEDAARRVSGALESYPEYRAWQGEVAHFESLHPHDAVALFAGQRN